MRARILFDAFAFDATFNAYLKQISVAVNAADAAGDKCFRKEFQGAEKDRKKEDGNA